MTAIFQERVLEDILTSHSGVGVYQLNGARAGYRGYVAAYGTAVTVGYFAQTSDGSVWEAGFGTLTDSAPDTISRNLFKSSTGSLISWSAIAGRVIYCVPLADILGALVESNQGSSRPTWLPAKGQFLDTTTATDWKLTLYDGADNIPFSRFDPTTNIVRLPTLGDLEVISGSNQANKILQEILVDAGALIGPIHDLFRDSATPAAADLLGQLMFSGRSSTAVQRAYAYLVASIITATNGAEDGALGVQALVAGADTQLAKFGPGLQVGAAPTGGDKGIGTINSSLQHFIGGVPTLRSDILSNSALTSASPTNPTNHAMIYIASGAGFTLTLPAISSVFGGFRVGLFNAITSGTCVANRSSTDTIVSQGTGGLTTVTLPSNGDFVWFIADATNSKWYLQGKRSFEGAEFAPVITTVTAQAHSLGVIPKQAWYCLRNKTTELGYSVGDEVMFQSLGDMSATGSGSSITADATNLTHLTMTILAKVQNKGSAGAYVAITAGNWKFVIRAEVFD